MTKIIFRLRSVSVSHDFACYRASRQSTHHIPATSCMCLALRTVQILSQSVRITVALAVGSHGRGGLLIGATWRPDQEPWTSLGCTWLDARRTRPRQRRPPSAPPPPRRALLATVQSSNRFLAKMKVAVC